jgi:hypothetical protein
MHNRFYFVAYLSTLTVSRLHGVHGRWMTISKENQCKYSLPEENDVLGENPVPVNDVEIYMRATEGRSSVTRSFIVYQE